MKWYSYRKNVRWTIPCEEFVAIINNVRVRVMDCKTSHDLALGLIERFQEFKGTGLEEHIDE